MITEEKVSTRLAHMIGTLGTQAAIADERARAHELRDSGKFPWTPDQPGCPDEHRLAVLMEEVGEAAQAVLQMERADLRAELVQVAAVAISWIEGLKAEDFEEGV